jgi:hypothetical protein
LQIGLANCFSSSVLYASQGSADDTALQDIGFPYTLTLETYSPWAAVDNGGFDSSQRHIIVGVAVGVTGPCGLPAD